MSAPREIVYAPAAVRTLRKMGTVEAARILAKVEQYALDPAALANNVRALRGSDLRRLRVGDYRVLFTETLEVVAVIRIGHRREVYE